MEETGVCGMGPGLRRTGRRGQRERENEGKREKGAETNGPNGVHRMQKESVSEYVCVWVRGWAVGAH